MRGVSPEVSALVRHAVAAAEDKELWGVVLDQGGHPAHLVMLGEIAATLHRMEGLMRETQVQNAAAN